MNLNNFFSELRRRNIYKVAVAYAVVAWLLIQIATQVFPFFEIPNWAVRLVVLLLLIGFPIALILSWAFEFTPQGIKRTEEVPVESSITHKTGRKLIVLTLLVALVAGGLLTFQLLRVKRAPKIAAFAPAIPEKSIAVLPFENLSSDKENAYFAEGIQDEILTRLAKIGDLKVISRTSTKQYQSKPERLIEIGKELGVANILEGSVQKVGQAVHINVQLIKAATDAHLWAESYDRQLQNIFGVEGEVAGAIAQQLNAKLTGVEEKAIATKPTENAAAYDAYLRGVSTENMGAVSDAPRKAAAAYTEAIQLDPKFALAWARLAVVRSYLYFNGIDPVVNSAGAVKEAADRAIALQPDLGEAWVAQGVYRYRVLRDFPAALKSYAEALRRLPNSSLVFEQMGHVERRLGQLDAAKKHYLMASQLDPRNVEILFTIADLYESLRSFDDADAVLDHILQLSPGNQDAICNKAFIYQGEGRLEQSARQLGKISANSDELNVVVARTFQLIDERRFDAAIAQMEPIALSPKTSDPRGVLLLGYCQEWAGQKTDAHATFLRVISEIKPSPETVVPIDARQLLCYLAWAYAGIDDKEKALEAAQDAVEKYRDDVLAKPFADQTLAIVQARFGDLDAAIAALPHLLEVPNGITVNDLRLSPFWDPLRKDPRFIKLIAESTTSPNY